MLLDVDNGLPGLELCFGRDSLSEVVLLHYQVDNKYITLSFGLGADVAVNYIVSLPTLRQWGGNLNFGNNIFVAPRLNVIVHCITSLQSKGYHRAWYLTSNHLSGLHKGKLRYIML